MSSDQSALTDHETPVPRRESDGAPAWLVAWTNGRAVQHNQFYRRHPAKLPEWVRDFEAPVVRGLSQHTERMHAPDLSADGPRRLCEDRFYQKDERVQEREQLEGFYEPCTHWQCQSYFEVVADE